MTKNTAAGDGQCQSQHETEEKLHTTKSPQQEKFVPFAIGTDYHPISVKGFLFHLFLWGFCPFAGIFTPWAFLLSVYYRNSYLFMFAVIGVISVLIPKIVGRENMHFPAICRLLLETSS